ncbi:MAG: HEPN domain-containing protein [Thermoplasmatales archaeon]|nr:HEPN domain-containing protein [Thermoplasmatales archaeon]
MVNKFKKIDQEIDVTSKFLRKCNGKSTEIEAFLAQYLLVEIGATFESTIRQMVVDRAYKTRDLGLTTFIGEIMEGVNSLSVNDIRGNILRRFSEEFVKAFDSELPSDSAVISKYNNIVINRHKAAHGGKIEMTYEEVVQSYRESRKVIRLIAKILHQ